jgi:hypothetical protein
MVAVRQKLMEQNTILVKPVTTMAVVPFMNIASHVAFSQIRYNISTSQFYLQITKCINCGLNRKKFCKTF